MRFEWDRGIVQDFTNAILHFASKLYIKLCTSLVNISRGVNLNKVGR